jgi:hypothetical protein
VGYDQKPEESTDFATLDTEKLFRKLKSLDANPTNTISPSLEFALSCLAAASDEQYESIPDDEIALFVRKFWAMHKFQKDMRRGS